MHFNWRFLGSGAAVASWDNALTKDRLWILDERLRTFILLVCLLFSLTWSVLLQPASTVPHRVLIQSTIVISSVHLYSRIILICIFVIHYLTHLLWLVLFHWLLLVLLLLCKESKPIRLFRCLSLLRLLVSWCLFETETEVTSAAWWRMNLDWSFLITASLCSILICVFIRIHTVFILPICIKVSWSLVGQIVSWNLLIVAIISGFLIMLLVLLRRFRLLLLLIGISLRIIPS